MHSLQQFLSSVQRDFGTGQAVQETSYYPALAALFNAVGATLSPKVFCTVHIQNKGAGLPDGGFFSASQKRSVEKNDDANIKENPLLAMLPERGVLEVKGADANLDVLKASAQVHKYLEKYGQVTLTNLRQFALVERDKNGALVEVERFTLADSADAFWKLDASQTAQSRGAEFEEFLGRCLMAGAPLSSPQDVAAFLASYAREARLRLEKTPLDALLPLKSALENALGVQFQTPDSKLSEAEQRERGDRFFRASLVQTLFYGLFSAWLSHVQENPDEDFDWRSAQWSLHVPMVGVLFEQLMQPSSLRKLELRELIELASRTLGRVQIEPFFQKWENALAVQYFYEPFLEKFDPVLRKELGVYYTPPEIVRYMVERVHRVLVSELGRPLGLADKDVVILDPCCGTGAFVVETLRKIAQVLEENGDSLVGHDLKEAATKRVFGFEILPAPFVVTHHGVGTLLKSYGAPLQDDERAAIYLTNALTGWTEEPKTKVMFPEMEAEREEAQKVKRQEKILVFIGNPPYDAFAKIAEDADLVKPYKDGLVKDWGIKKFNLDDLYVRFFRVAERRLTQNSEGVLSQNSEGVLCFVSNYSWTSEPSFVQMRRSLLNSFDSVWIDVLNGDSRATGKRTPEGLPDPSIFSTSFNPAGIRVGTAIGLMTRAKTSPDETSSTRNKVVRSRNLWGTQKREELLESLAEENFDALYQEAQPQRANRFSLRPLSVAANYESWPKVTELAIEYFNGPIERRGNSLIVHKQSESELEKLTSYLDAAIEDAQIEKIQPLWMRSAGEFDAQKTRGVLKNKAKFNANEIVDYPFKPLDIRRAYLSPDIAPLFSRPSPELIRHSKLPNNAFFITRDSASRQREGAMMLFSSVICDYDVISGHARHFPIFISQKTTEEVFTAATETSIPQRVLVTTFETRANLSSRAREYLASLGLPSPDDESDESREVAALLWNHALAIGYAPQYRAEHADGLSSDWPRVPLPNDAKTLRDSSALGAQVSGLLDVSRGVVGVTSAPLYSGMKLVGRIARVDGAQINVNGGDLKVDVNWGSLDGKKNVMPGGGRVLVRVPTEEERTALDALGSTDESVLDIYLNANVCWKCVPKSAWETIIGGYQVLKKWLSYRDFKVLGRDLSVDEVREVEQIVRRLSALCALQNELNANYVACAAE